MESVQLKTLEVETSVLLSRFLERSVTIDIYRPRLIAEQASLSLLLLNDGQDLPEMNISEMLDGLVAEGKMHPVLCVGIHAGTDRKMEYGTANSLDYEGRGAKAKKYEHFILNELLPHIQTEYKLAAFHKSAFAGFSLGGLMALDLSWHYPHLFPVAAVFSGSLWWRSKGLDDGYNEATDRIMHRQIRQRSHHAGQKFYFTTGSLDETSDRNNNGIIDSIDDTLDLIGELKKLGYGEDAIHYINYEDGKHDIATWGRAMPHFLTWAFEKVHPIYESQYNNEC